MLGISCLVYAYAYIYIYVRIWVDRYIGVDYDHTFNLTCSVHFLTILRKGDQKKSVVSEEKREIKRAREKEREREREKTFKVDDKKCGLHLDLERLLKSYLAQLQYTRIKRTKIMMFFLSTREREKEMCIWLFSPSSYISSLHRSFSF
jgi:hypothetical protein